MKKLVPLSEWIFRSYVLHGVILLAIAWIALFGPFHKAPAPTMVCEFVLQQRAERNDEKTNRIALNSAKAHGKRDPHDDPNKIDGAPPAAGGGASSATHNRASVRHYQPKINKRASARNTTEIAFRKPAKRPRSNTTAKRAPARRYEAAPVEVATGESTPSQAQEPSPTQSQESSPDESQDSSPSVAGEHSHSFLREWLGRHLNPDRDTDNGDPSYAANASPDFGPYMNYLHRVLAKAWTPPDSNGGHCVKVLFDIHRAGEISGLHIIRSCGNARYDRAALEAVSQASPFRPLPPGAPSSVSIEYTFDYHVYRHH
jgi:TonB family protein